MNSEIISPTPAPGRCSFLRRAVPKPAKLVAPLLCLLGLTTAPDITANIKLPTNDYGLFVTAKDPNSKYLIETNPELTTYTTFISSDYLLNKVKTSPEQSLKRVGDGFYETKLIRDSIFQQTGLRYLNNDLKNDQQQFQYLMDNAVTTQGDLQLRPGVSLTQAQREALTRDIVWMEEKVVAGQKVLVPVVYIANATSYQLKGSKIVAGGDVSLKAAQFTNSGEVKSGGNLTIEASQSVTNFGGLHATKGLSITAQNNIENISGTMSGETVTLASITGDIINRRNTQSQSMTSGGSSISSTTASEAGMIRATSGLSLTAANGTISIIGSTLEAESMALKAAKVDILATEERHAYRTRRV